jgi:hypothetical protein
MMARFTVKQADQIELNDLTEFYNQTRSDYLVPMPMTPEELAEYVLLYDISLVGERFRFDRRVD